MLLIYWDLLTEFLPEGFDPVGHAAKLFVKAIVLPVHWQVIAHNTSELLFANVHLVEHLLEAGGAVRLLVGLIPGSNIGQSEVYRPRH